MWTFLGGRGNDRHPHPRLIRHLSRDTARIRSQYRFKILREETQNPDFAAQIFYFCTEILTRDSKGISLGLQSGSRSKTFFFFKFRSISILCFIQLNVHLFSSSFFFSVVALSRWWIRIPGPMQNSDQNLQKCAAKKLLAVAADSRPDQRAKNTRY